MKTAISIPGDLFEHVSRYAIEEHVSRSKVIADAIREYIERRRNRTLLAALNDAYGEEESAEEKEVRKRARKHYARKIRREKW